MGKELTSIENIETSDTKDLTQEEFEDWFDEQVTFKEFIK